MSEHLLKTAISGSFGNFKPEIDALHEQFRDHGVIVLEPAKGWLWTPQVQLTPTSFRPLPDERGLSVGQISRRFLRAIDQADFLYVFCPQRYIGLSACFEIGYALAGETPVYTSDTPDFMELAEGDLERKAFLESSIVTAGVAQVVMLERAKLEQTE